MRFAGRRWSLRILSRGSRHWLNCTSFAVPLAATCALLSKRRIRLTKSLCARVSLTEVTLSAHRSGFCALGLPAKQIDETLIVVDNKLLTIAVHSACARFSILVPRTRHESVFTFFSTSSAAAQRDAGILDQATLAMVRFYLDTWRR